MILEVLSKKAAQLCLASCFTVAAFSGAAFAADMPAMPQPTAQHQWLQQLVGEWEGETEAMMDPTQPPVKTKATESAKAIGGFWVAGEYKGTMMDKPFNGVMTIGYDTGKQKYVATWVDSMTGKLWEYEGAVDASGKVLTLETEGECPMNPGKITKMKDVVEFIDVNHKTYTSYVQGEDGKWTKMMTSTATRK